MDFINRTSVAYICIVIFILSLNINSTAAEGCETAVQNTYEKIATALKNRNNCVYMRYTMTTILSEGKQPKPVSTEVICKEDRIRVISDEVRLYYDKSDALAIIPATKNIIIRKKAPGQNQKAYDDIMGLHKKFMAVST